MSATDSESVQAATALCRSAVDDSSARWGARCGDSRYAPDGARTSKRAATRGRDSIFVKQRKVHGSCARSWRWGDKLSIAAPHFQIGAVWLKTPANTALPRAFPHEIAWLLRASSCLFSCSPVRLPCSCSRWRGSPLSAHRRCGSRRLPGASSARSRTRSRRVSRGTASPRSFSQATGVRAAFPLRPRMTAPPHDSSPRVCRLRRGLE